MTKNRFLSAYKETLISSYDWAKDPEKLSKFMDSVASTLDGMNTWNANGEAIQAAWKQIGMTGKANLKKLRSLPID
jgi:hypothetical protein